ncbi:MAG: 1-acyl-sn-glycerol-3-phosphate acyltransferase [Actinomycetota bacterium]|nr:1-acyl-sn-glycerol-3-phosphate acyltransferase [Actinomycetota bacterium]
MGRRLEGWARLAEAVLRPPMAVGFRLRFEGLEHLPREGPVLVAANHISYLDPIAHAYFVRKAHRWPRFLAKVELYRNPVVGTVLRGARQIPVRRGSGDIAPVENGVRALRAGEVVVVYPEGTVTGHADHSPMSGRTGIARLALATGVPVVPVAVWGTQHVWQRDGVRIPRFGRPLWLKAGAPLDVSVSEGRRDDPAVLRQVTDQVMAELSVLVEDLRARYPKRWA